MAENFIQLYWPSSLNQDTTTESETSSTPKLDFIDKSVGSPLPSFDTFCRGRNDASLSSDQSTTASESSFSIESLIRASTSAPRSSTPEIQRETVISQFGTSSDLEQIGATTTEPQKVNRRHTDKPPYTYMAMCVMAIEMSPRKALTQIEIQEQLKRMFPFFNGSYTGWKESVRACLSRSKYFVRIQSLEEPRQSFWTVDRQTLTPGLFKKRVFRGSSEGYKDYLHDQLGVSPICSVPQKPKPDDTGSIKNMVLPDIQCFQETVTAEPSESEDFLQAHRDINCDKDDEECKAPLHSISDTASQPTSSITGGKRKLGVDYTSETVAKKSCKTSTHVHDSQPVSNMSEITTGQTGYGLQDDQTYTGYWNYGQYPGNAYQNYQSCYPQYNPLRIQNYRHYSYQWPTGYYYGQPQMPHTQYNAAMTQAAQVRYQAALSGYTVAQHMLNRYRQWNSQNSKCGDHQYDYRWYNALTEDDNVNGVDLSTTSSDSQ